MGITAYSPDRSHHTTSQTSEIFANAREWARKNDPSIDFRRALRDITMTPSTIRDRLPYQPIVTRPKLRLPGDARVAVWTIVNVENWSPSDPMPRAVLPPPMGQPLLPDVPNWAWHEYGMRVGFWRFLEALDARGLKASFAVNGTACSLYEEACRSAFAASWDFIGHGYVQRPMHRGEDQRSA